ncbi:uncharacterized protein LOC131587997 [Poecile atricapillus]|uniref:uncharacterized protein LOC131587997 n=1 Tax=Poecile atricapillus TaxID=48891 RepID=UPI0027393140|nr:uncharacterized protein LOC131587997 [Poecile atricapillus]
MTPPCQCPTLYPVPNAKVTTAFLLHSPLLPKKRSLPPPAQKPAACPSSPVTRTASPQSSPPAPKESRGCSPKPPTPGLAGSAGRGRHCSPRVVSYGSQLPLSPERFRRRVTHELECAKPPANRASCLRPRGGGCEGRAAGPAPRHSTPVRQRLGPQSCAGIVLCPVPVCKTSVPGRPKDL